MRGPRLGEDLRCPAEHKTGKWPGIARCVLQSGHTLLTHEDWAGRIWTTELDGTVRYHREHIRRPSWEPGNGRIHNL